MTGRPEDTELGMGPPGEGGARDFRSLARSEAQSRLAASARLRDDASGEKVRPADPAGFRPPLSDRRDEAEAILRRVRQETEPQIGLSAERMSQGVRRHFWGGDADPADRIEVWGTRIGRLAGLAAFCGLAAYLAVNLMAQ